MSVKLNIEKHLTEQLPYIENTLRTNNIYLEARPGLGKTFLVNDLAKTHHVLLVTPMCSTRDGSTSHLGNLKVLETKDLASTKELDSELSYAVIWDTFVLMIERNMLSSFDLVVLDESHKMVQHSSFRESQFTVAEWLTKTKTRYMMMTGTPMGEDTLFYNLEHIKIIAPEHRNLTLNFIMCKNQLLVESALLATAKLCAEHKKKTIFFSNSNRSMQDRIIAKLVKKNKIGFYSSSMSDKKLEDLINKQETFGDYDMVCATEYLAEGVNIKIEKDEEAAVIVTDEADMTPMLLMQIANRFRDTDISIYFIHNVVRDKVTKEKTLNEKARDEVKSNNGIKLSPLADYLIHDANYIVGDKSLVSIGTNEYAVDGLRKEIQDLLVELKKITHVKFFKEYFEHHNYTVNEVHYEKEKVIELKKKKYDVSRFIGHNLKDILDLLATISIEKKIYTKDVLKEDKLNKSRIEENVIMTQSLNVFNNTIKKVKRLLKDGVLSSSVSKILDNPQRYGTIDNWYKALDILSTWSEEYEEPLSNIKESTAKALVLAKVDKELKSLRSQYPNFCEAIIEKETSKIHDVYSLAQKLEVAPQDLVHLYNRLKDPNYAIVSYEFDLYADLNELIDKKDKAFNENLTENRRKASSTYNNSTKKACQLYKDGVLIKEFDSKNAAYKYLGVNKIKFKNGEAKIGENIFRII